MVGLACRSWRILNRLKQVGTDLLLPPRCARCDVDLSEFDRVALCAACQADLSSDDAFCPRCGQFGLGHGGHGTSCARCREAKLRFDSVIPLGPYRGTLRETILAMKRPSGECLSTGIAQLLLVRREHLLRGFDADCIVPTPMYWGRRVWRGVNSAQVLSEELSRHLRVPVLEGGLIRNRNTLPQKDLGHAERFRNVRGAFSLRRGYGLGGARVIVVDDIMTTGATCNEVAKVLKKGGVNAVCAVVVGRAAVGR